MLPKRATLSNLVHSVGDGWIVRKSDTLAARAAACNK